MKETGNVKQKAYRGLAWQVGTVTIAATANIVFVAVMGRLLEPAAFGQFALASVVVALTMIFAQFGFGPALVQRETLSEDDISFVFCATVAVGTLAAGVIMAMSGFISARFDGNVEPKMIGVLALNLIFSTLGVASRFLLVRDLEFRKLFVASNGSYILGNMGVGFTLAAAGYGAWALVIGLLAGNLATSLILLYLRPIRIRLRLRDARTRSIFEYGMGLTMVQFLNQSAQQVDKLLLGRIATLPLLGAFERAQRIQSLPLTYAGSSLDGVLFSVMSKSAQDRPALGRFFFPTLALLAFGTGYISVVIYFFAGDIITTLLGDGWTDAQRVLSILAILIFIQTFPRFADTLVRSTNEFRRTAIVKAVFLASMVIAVPVGSYLGGFDGAVLGVVAATVIHAVGMVILCTRITTRPISQVVAHLAPTVGFVMLLAVKNWLLSSVVPDLLAVRILATLITDVGIFGAYFGLPWLLGKQNAEFVAARLGDIGRLAPIASVYRRRIDWVPNAADRR